MAPDTRDPFRTCDICGTPMIYTRRVTRSTYVCPHSSDQGHVEARRARRSQRQIEEIERHVRH